MNKQHKMILNVLVWLIVIASLISLTSVLVFATGAECKINISYEVDNKPVSNMEFQLYRVGQYDSENGIAFIGDYADYPLDMDTDLSSDLQNLINTLYSYILLDGLTPDYTVNTGFNGTASISGLPEGVYLLACPAFRSNGKLHSIQPQLLILPFVDGNPETDDNEVSINIKGETIPSNTPPITVKVLKKWEDGNSPDRPTEVIVALLKDGRVHDVAILNHENSWRHIWEDLEANAIWLVTEDFVPGYTVSIQREGNTFLIVNSKDVPTPPTDPTDPSDPTDSTKPGDSDDPTDPTKPSDLDDPSNPTKPGGPTDSTVPSGDPLPPPDGGTEPTPTIPQTGMTWWPLPVLISMGLTCIVVGAVMRRRDL